MGTGPQSFKDISVKGILWAIVIFIVTIGLSIVASYHMPLKRKFIGDISVSFLSSLAFPVVLKHRNEAIKAKRGKNEEVTKWYGKNIPRLIFVWAVFYLFVSMTNVFA